MPLRSRQHSRQGGLVALMHRLLQPRQVYVRSRNNVQFVTFSPVSQLALLVIVLLGLFWLAYASVNILFKNQLLELREQNMFDARIDYENRVADLRASIEKANDRLLLDQQAYLKKFDGLAAEFHDLSRKHDEMEEFFRKGWFPLKRPETSGSRQPLPAETQFQTRFAADFTSSADAEQPSRDLRKSFSQLVEKKVQLAEKTKEYVLKKRNHTASLLLDLGITPRFTPAPATGGPFVPAIGVSQSMASLDALMTETDLHFRDRQRLLDEIAALPLGQPMPSSTGISSTFGNREDPLRKTLAFHGGIDFKGPYAAEVYTTSDGKVTWAGPHGPYGNLVEISHDNGVATRYGHLKSVRVSVGQNVRRGDLIGLMGNTGRSTGPHLHYETRVNGQVIDPERFWRTQNALQALEKY